MGIGYMSSNTHLNVNTEAGFNTEHTSTILNDETVEECWVLRSTSGIGLAFLAGHI
jgi:hypothetical protein